MRTVDGIDDSPKIVTFLNSIPQNGVAVFDPGYTYHLNSKA
jgi:hypothetical protein